MLNHDFNETNHDFDIHGCKQREIWKDERNESKTILPLTQLHAIVAILGETCNVIDENIVADSWINIPYIITEW